MEITIVYINKSGESVTENLHNIDKNCVYEGIGKFFPLIAIPSELNISVTDDNNINFNITYSARERGSYIKDGVTYPSMYVTVKRDEFLNHYSSELDFSHLKECYLTCVNPESNNYKYYHMIPTPTGIDVEYGRIGLAEGEPFGKKHVATPYHPSLYWVRYYEKLSKGYVDNSAAYLTETKRKPAKKKKEVETTSASSNISEAEKSLYNILLGYSRNYIKTNLVSEKVTTGQISGAKKIFRELCNRKTVKGFNSQLLKLMQISPRRVRDVSDLMANSTYDFSRIIDREESLIMAMEGVVDKDEITVQNKCFNHNIEVYYATDKQKEEVMKHLSPDLKSHVDTIYRVIPVEQKKRFDEYVKKNDIKTIKQLWHGSTNGNWLSIIENSLKISSGVAHGRMFGNGLYFAPSSKKSWGYTSYRGTYWANGRDDTAFMGLYAVAYGKPVDVNSSQYFTETEVKRRGGNCVHAHAGASLRNDEIVFYNENAVLLNYIVKFK